MPSINTILPLALLLGAFTASAAPLNQCVILGVVVADPAADLQALQTANAACAAPPQQLAALENQLRECIIRQGGTPPTNVAPAAAVINPGAPGGPGGPIFSSMLGGMGLRRSFALIDDVRNKLNKSGGK
ncbi:hypothetical protein Hypma_007707 [Hypsizygus marmoreus]|uniref:Uncharacterized protein n=1 Tax=Hypsizygus marmoreus TaxID=39966 RepID=A0A369JY78_HYPMA|nr:hypothetical protein Hypma_007707 [Hypsizygus marmoreus]